MLSRLDAGSCCSERKSALRTPSTNSMGASLSMMLPRPRRVIPVAWPLRFSRNEIWGASRRSTSHAVWPPDRAIIRSEEHTSELQSHSDLVCRLLLEKKKKIDYMYGVMSLNNEDIECQQ